MSLDKTSESAKPFSGLKITLMLGIGVLAFSSNVISELGRVLKSRPVTATVTERVQTCRVVVRNDDRTRTRTQMPCDEAYALRKADETRRTRVYRTTYVVLSYPLRTGVQHTARVRESRVRARKLPVGSEIQIAYSKRNPNTVTRPKSWGGVIRNAVLAFGCFIGLMLVLFGRQAVTDYVSGRMRKPYSTSAGPAKTPSTYRDIMANLEKIVDGSGWRGDVGSGWKKPKPAAQPRRHKKPAPLPVTGGVVSKRRDGLFGLLS